eukprot:scaffold13339_cov28-Tisochrysis_lutea.AAC.2
MFCPRPKYETTSSKPKFTFRNAREVLDSIGWVASFQGIAAMAHLASFGASEAPPTREGMACAR